MNPTNRTTSTPWSRLVRHTLLALTAVMASACASENADPVDGSDDLLIIRGGWVFTGTGTEFEPNSGIVIRDSILSGVGEAIDESMLADAEVIELGEDDYIIPGMFDLHAHYAVDLLGNGRVDETEAYPAMFLANGVTSTFPAGEVNPYRMRDARIAIESGERPGTRIFNSGPYFGTAREGWDPEAMTRDSIRAEVDYWIGQGARGFKAKNLDPERVGWLVEAAHEHGVTVTGHLGSGSGDSTNPRDAILMGIDRIEHFMGGDAMPASRSAYASLVGITPDMPEVQRIIDLFKEHEVFFDATRSAYGYYGAREPEVFDYFAPEMDYFNDYARSRIEERLPRRVNDQFETIYWVKQDLIAEFYRQGGGEWITLGTDHPSWGEYLSPFSVHREMHALNKSGIPTDAVLRIATINGARALGVDDRLGTLESGKLADLVILGANPLTDIRNTRHVRTVVKNGEVYDPSSLLTPFLGTIGPRDSADEANW